MSISSFRIGPQIYTILRLVYFKLFTVAYKDIRYFYFEIYIFNLNWEYNNRNNNIARKAGYSFFAFINKYNYVFDNLYSVIRTFKILRYLFIK
jgi:hypothetical protein